MAAPGLATAVTRVGMNRYTGEVLTGWDHCLQSLHVILTTALRTRVMRLTFGSDVPNLIDRPATPTVIMQWYIAILDALVWEPGYRVTNLQVPYASADGSFTFDLDGIYYPRGHLGDFSVSQSQPASLKIFI